MSGNRWGNCRGWLVVLVLFAQGALADEYHYVNMLIGDRAAGMGGAYTAVSDDAAGLFYNPAGIAYAQGASLSGSMNTYEGSSVRYKQVLGGTYDWERQSSSLLPNFFGVVQPLGEGTVGFSYAVPNSIEEDQDQEFDNIAGANRFIINFNNNDQTYLFGPSYAQKINDDLAIGMTLYLQRRQQQLISNILLQYTDDRLWSNTYYELEEWGIKPVVGVMWSPLDRIALGATLSQTTIISSSAKRYETCLGANASPASGSCEPGNIVNHTIATSGEKVSYPLNIRLGGAWFASDALLVSADASYHASYTIENQRREAVVNFALGTEYYLTSRWALRGGLYTDFSNAPPLQQGVTAYNQPEHIDLYGMSASLTHFTRNSSITVGFNYSAGSGQAQMVAGDSALQDAEMESFSLSLASSYTY